jgi:hypothetical protein
VQPLETAGNGKAATKMTAQRDAELEAFGFDLAGDPAGKCRCPRCGQAVGRKKEKRRMEAHILKCTGSPGKRAAAGGYLEWEVLFGWLVAYKAKQGDCDVPYGWADDPRLGRWVHRQRRCKRALDCGQPSYGMTTARVAKLEAIGFAWEASGRNAAHEVAWEEKFVRLAAYEAEHGDCAVPTRWAEDPQLATWVDNQRMMKRNLDHGKTNNGMTAARAAKLTALGFVWESPLEVYWEAQLVRLAAYKAAHGHCNAPRDRGTGLRDPAKLGNWVNTQRKGKKQLDCGETAKGHSCRMTVERAAKLEALGFEWDMRPVGKAAEEEQGEEPEAAGAAGAGEECVQEIGVGARVSARAVVFGKTWAMEVRWPHSWASKGAFAGGWR